MDSTHRGSGKTGRREFLTGVCGGAAALAASGAVLGGGPSLAEDKGPAAPLPTIKLGKFTVTRMIAGGNPIEGFSHSTPGMRDAMLEWFTLERTIEFLEKCVREGINTWQFDHMPKIVTALRTVRERGAKLNFICIHADRHPVNLKTVIADQDPIAIVHHGGVTDALFRQGKAQDVRDFVKKVHDHGVMAGVSTHNPENLKRIADEGWEVDLFMTCFYHLTRTVEEQRKQMGKAAVFEPFYDTDPLEMTDVVLKLKQPCLGFKILAAGRKCWTPEEVEGCFKFAFERLKKCDAVIVGMFPKYRDEVRENAAHTRKHGALASQVGKA